MAERLPELVLRDLAVTQLPSAFKSSNRVLFALPSPTLEKGDLGTSYFLAFPFPYSSTFLAPALHTLCMEHQNNLSDPWDLAKVLKSLDLIGPAFFDDDFWAL